jgi:hypothetical protein
MLQIIRLVIKKVCTFEYAPRYSRLAGDIAVYEPQLKLRIATTDSAEKQWAIQALALLEKAKKYLKEYKIDEGWKSFHSAKRYEVFAMNRQERLACTKSLLKEAENLDDWRKNAIIVLLDSTNANIAEFPVPEVLIQACELKDEYYNDRYYMNRLSYNLFWLLSGLLFFVLFAIVIYFSLTIDSNDKTLNTELNLTQYIVGVLLFGFLGAITSAILFMRNLSESARMKELSSSQVIILSKLFIGAGFSVFIFLVLRSSFAGTIKLFNFTMTQPIDYFTIAFVSGFTERLAQKSMDLLIGKEKETTNAVLNPQAPKA